MTCGWQQVNTTGSNQQNSLLAATPALGKSRYFPLCSTAEEIRMLFVLRKKRNDGSALFLFFYPDLCLWQSTSRTPEFLLKRNPWQLVPLYIIHFANNNTMSAS